MLKMSDRTNSELEDALLDIQNRRKKHINWCLQKNLVKNTGLQREKIPLKKEDERLTNS